MSKRSKRRERERQPYSPCPKSDTGGHWWVLTPAELELSQKWFLNADYFDLIQQKGIELPAKAKGRCKLCDEEREFSGGMPDPDDKYRVWVEK